MTTFARKIKSYLCSFPPFIPMMKSASTRKGNYFSVFRFFLNRSAKGCIFVQAKVCAVFMIISEIQNVNLFMSDSLALILDELHSK